jgi:hypothetical protein
METGIAVEIVVEASIKSLALVPTLPSNMTVVPSDATARKYEAVPFAPGVTCEIAPNVITPAADTELPDAIGV